MIASVHIADIGFGRALSVLRKPPRAGSISGLRHANVGLAAPLSKSPFPKPSLGRVALLGFWDDDAAVDRFLSDHPLAAKLAGGWRVRLEPLRAFGTWPGLPSDVPRSRTTDYAGPSAVFTLGRLRISQAVRFLRTSAKAENAVLGAPGVIWATGLARPPFVSTCSLWESPDAISRYAFADGAHNTAITTDREKPFHHESAFIRFRPYASEGKLDGKNALPEHWLTPV